MYTTTAGAQRETDARAAKEAAEVQRRASMGKAKMTRRRAEEAAFAIDNESGEGRKGEKFNIKRVSHLPKPVRKIPFVEKPKSFNGLNYDATKNKRNGEFDRPEPKTVEVLAEDDPALFRQSMDMVKLQR